MSKIDKLIMKLFFTLALFRASHQYLWNYLMILQNFQKLFILLCFILCSLACQEFLWQSLNLISCVVIVSILNKFLWKYVEVKGNDSSFFIWLLCIYCDGNINESSLHDGFMEFIRCYFIIAERGMWQCLRPYYFLYSGRY